MNIFVIRCVSNDTDWIACDSEKHRNEEFWLHATCEGK